MNKVPIETLQSSKLFGHDSRWGVITVGSTLGGLFRGYSKKCITNTIKIL